MTKLKGCQPSKWYRWVLLVASCSSQIFCSGYVVGTATLLSVFYEDHFQERKLSGMIGTIQLASSLLLSLPAIYLKKRVNERWIQIIGGILMTVGIATTAFTDKAWQAAIATGVVSGVGAAVMRTATYSITAKYFPGHQLVPYAALMLCFNLGSMIFPPLISSSMANLGFTKTILILAGLTSLNVISGIFFIPLEAINHEIPQKTRPKFTLKIKDNRKGIYILPSPSDIDSQVVKPMEVDVENCRPITDEIFRRSSFLSSAVCDEGKDYEFSLQDTNTASAAEEHHKDDNSAGSNESSCSSLLKLLNRPAVVMYLIYAFLNSFSTVTFSAVAGDYMKHQLEFTNEEFAFGFTVLGITSLVSVLAYLVFTHFFSFSSTFLQVFTTLSKGFTWITLLFISKPVHFTVLMGIYGATKSFGNMYACCMEIATPENAVLMYMLELTMDGIGGTIAPFVATYLQVDVDVRAGFIMAGSAIIFGSLVFLPVSLKTLFTPKEYKCKNEEDSLTISHLQTSM